MDRPEEMVEHTVVLGYVRTSECAVTGPALQLESHPVNLAGRVVLLLFHRVDEAQGPIGCRRYGRSEGSRLYRFISVDGCLHSTLCSDLRRWNGRIEDVSVQVAARHVEKFEQSLQC